MKVEVFYEFCPINAPVEEESFKIAANPGALFANPAGLRCMPWNALRRSSSRTRRRLLESRFLGHRSVRSIQSFGSHLHGWSHQSKWRNQPRGSAVRPRGGGGMVGLAGDSAVIAASLCSVQECVNGCMTCLENV